MIEIERPNIITVDLSEDGKHGTFVIEPLERGYGITLGNSLRRVLLSSLPGVAATSIKIEGVLHEISTVPGVKEDVTEIVLNIKGVVAKLYTQSPKTVFIKTRTGGEITAGDIVCDSDIEILNPEHHIATVEEGAEFYMEITFDHGRGYVSSDKNKQLGTSVIGLIYTDSIYTPVYNVNYKVENTRVGNITDYDKLTLDLVTNGTINAKEAVSLAAKILSEHLNLFIELSPPCERCGEDALTITGTTVTGNKGTLFVTAAGFDFEGCAEDAVTIDRIRKGRCINAEAGTRKKGTFGI